MGATLRKYREVSRVHLKSQLAWRADVMFQMFFTIGRILFAYLLWKVIFAGRDMVAGFEFDGILSYYIFSSFITQLDLSQGISEEIHDRIRRGTFSKYMVLPVHTEGYFLAMEVGVVLFYLVFDLIAAFVWVLVFGIRLQITGEVWILLCAVLMVVLGLLFMVQLMVFSAIYGNVERIGTWDRGAMLVYIGSFSLLNAVSMSLCFFGVISIPEKIRSGELDLYLTKPVSPLFRLSFEQINPGSLPLVGMSLCIIGYGIWTGGMRPGGRQVAAYLLWMLLMAVLYYDMEVLMRSLSFYVLSTSRMDQLEEASLELCMKLPGTALYGGYKLLFYCLLPYGLMATVPVQSLIGELSLAGGLWAFGIVAGFSLLTAAVWRRGISRYESASS